MGEPTAFASTFLASVTVLGSTVTSFSRATTAGVPPSWQRPPRYLAKNFSAASMATMLFTGRAKPCPSSGNRMYSTGAPRSRSATTICSDSAWFTRGSFAPCAISSGVLIFSAELSGERSFSSALPSSVLRSPMRTLNILRAGSQYGGIESSRVIRLDGPNRSTAAA